MEAHLRFAGIDARPLSRFGPEAVADRILDAQRDEFQALEWALDRRDIDTDRLFRAAPAFPGGFVSQLVDVIFRRIAPVGDLPEDARGDARVQIGCVANRPVGAEMHATGNGLQAARTGIGQVFKQ